MQYEHVTIRDYGTIEQLTRAVCGNHQPDNAYYANPHGNPVPLHTSPQVHGGPNPNCP